MPKDLKIFIKPNQCSIHPLPDAVPMPPDFVYASDTNTNWLSVEDLRNLIKEEIVE
ncbi:MAG: hypothetical protein HGA25_04205 [Clostridiales bacterium]|nr:hypothetical protein [Clostridiales bacterium]